MIRKSPSRKAKVMVSGRKKSSPVKNKSTVKHYSQVLFISLFISLIVFAGGNYFFTSRYCANSRTCTSDLKEQVDNNATGNFEGHTIIPPKIGTSSDILKHSVLDANVPAGEKHIYVDLATQTLYAYEGATKIMQTFIASGKWGRTPVGNFHIWEKLPATRMAGGEGADAYDLPNVPWTMYFYHDFGLHGAYWHNNFGHPMSHGCVNMRIVDAAALYSWADGPTVDQLGTAVSICNQFTAPNACKQENPIN